MSRLEQIVRPSQSSDIRPRLVAGLQVPQEEKEILPKVWGSSGNSMFVAHAHTSADIKPIESEEIRRKYNVVRVMNPEDHSQYVDTEVMTEYQARNKIDGKRTVMLFATNTLGPDEKLLKKDQVRAKGGVDF